MRLKYISRVVCIAFMSIFFNSCEEKEYEFGDITTPSNIDIVATIVGQDATNPNGDGSGTVHFEATASNALSYKFVYNGSESVKPNGRMTYNFSELGVNTYTVTVIAVGAGGVSSSKTIQVDVLALYSAPDDLKTLLYGYDPSNPTAASSKTWRVKAEIGAHFGLGPVGGSVFAEWYQAGANEKDGVGMYDDRFTFHSDGTFEYVTNGDVFGRVNLIDQLGGSGGTVDGADVLNYSYGDYSENWTLTAPGGVETLSLTGIGFIGYYIGNHTYEIFSRSNPNEMSLRITDGNNEFDWWFVITSEDPAPPSAPYVYNNLVWEDDFNTDGAPDASKWTYDIGTGSNGWGNNEVQYYTDRADNAVVSNGNLIITAKKEDFSGSGYTSARLKTQGLYNFTYGRVEVRAKLPDGAGTWPAIWMLGSNFPTVGWPVCGEIDIMEQTGGDKNSVLSAAHWFDTTNNVKADFTQNTSITNATSDFHVYTMEWTDQSITVYLDDVKYYELTNSSSLPFNDNFFLILNIAMGGTLGGSIDAGFTESTMEVDYVRVYQ
ncbi:glycosyl hydrolase family 16 [Tenacibaculum skagerrakense]|uniref:Glycosyl hydrolase family 16 n=1 Tax=Tenacibaculum skagerrakense TaxID=186571 RepID=A0A4R2NPJ4_9FLAO|nr:glycoside hydrolase family 16 protein [Tenacibaculum skagerrakense]TCP23278.1 glycosyl hydrolase family 16 [Tenacibaculum skagerrakense]